MENSAISHSCTESKTKERKSRSRHYWRHVMILALASARPRRKIEPVNADSDDSKVFDWRKDLFGLGLLTIFRYWSPRPPTSHPCDVNLMNVRDVSSRTLVRLRKTKLTHSLNLRWPQVARNHHLKKSSQKVISVQLKQELINTSRHATDEHGHVVRQQIYITAELATFLVRLFKRTAKEMKCFGSFCRGHFSALTKCGRPVHH